MICIIGVLANLDVFASISGVFFAFFGATFYEAKSALVLVHIFAFYTSVCFSLSDYINGIYMTFLADIDQKSFKKCPYIFEKCSDEIFFSLLCFEIGKSPFF